VDAHECESVQRESKTGWGEDEGEVMSARDKTLEATGEERSTAAPSPGERWERVDNVDTMKTPVRRDA